ncbi:MAG: thioredoxin domain-containing protein [Bacteroidota bacterium]
MKNLFRTPPHTTDHALHTLLKTLKVKVTKTSCNECVQNHPDYPSLMAIGGCLTDMGVENHTYLLDKETYKDGLLFPFVAHFPERGGRFLLVTAIEGKQIFYSDELTHNGILGEEEFLKRWDGIALHAEPTTESGEVEYAQNRFKEFLKSLMAPLAILSLILLLYLTLANQAIHWNVLALSGLKLIGIGISILLLMQSLNANNPFIKNLCTLNGKNDCNAILKSDAAKITSWLTWSEVGFFYFTGSFLTLLFDPTSLPLLAWLNLCALPYTIYSISYQYRNKNWCVLCSAVQVLLVLEAITFLSSQNYELLAFPTFALTALACFLVPVLTWAFLKPFFTDASQIKSVKQQLKKFKYNSELFNQALTNQPRYAIPDELMPVVLGNPNAETTITMVSNPFCGPCAKAHETLDQWLKTRDDIKIKVIFTTSNHDDDEKTKVSRHVSALSLLNDAKLLENALNDWYRQGDKKYEAWAKRYPIAFNGEMNKVTEKQKEWCSMAEISSTPTILVNGYKLPDPYRLEDIKYLVE